MKPSLFMTREIPKRGLDIIRENFDVDLWPDEAPPSKEEIIRRIKDKQALVSLLTDPIDEEVINSAPNLRIIAQYAVGFDNIDLKAATKRGIYVTNTPEVLTETTADFAFALMLAVARRVVEADKYVRNGKWKVAWHPLMMLGEDVHGRTLGIVGLGRIGCAVARRAKGFDMKILYYDVIRREDLERELGIKYVDLETLLRESDFVTIHTPLTPETYHLIGEKQLRMMKKTAFLINTSRGKVVDQKALYKALKEGWIAGAALDVFEQEPISMDDPLLELENVVLAPHIASATHETRSKMAEIVAENLLAFKRGEIPPTLVNKDVLNVRKPGFS
ncbi:MAG: D-glycerate dehydrogenase [Thermoproteota archaeon]|jgi:glyoxylate reductase|uniref:D-glycerate dehydrogenase n=1 Tax=Candidatus Methanodesulfokora washburnensis TaxID=2478471 RepID=A0A3R9RQA9_9CREN|nr:glyoxylate reductase [Candidatus Methanodesulfokores washburnensis]RSN75967.1 D-glycerate dehydrogenase [Candidatus Methanodesulfokores washburnensis]RZN62616.1 MAG: D-glycerate dehydrogenase [Candidatus Methanodesulfokores washburnensis]TDA42009.1 MAG: D-glycerate dehydrogenase [Candidatus Korarchaeota archaeon]